MWRAVDGAVIEDGFGVAENEVDVALNVAVVEELTAGTQARLAPLPWHALPSA